MFMIKNKPLPLLIALIVSFVSACAQDKSAQLIVRGDDMGFFTCWK
jgi:hypothetical protein